MSTICSYFNPCSQEFSTAIEEFKRFSCQKQVGILFITTLVACTIIFAPCATAVFRLLVDYYTPTSPLAPTDQKATEVSKKLLAPTPKLEPEIPKTVPAADPTQAAYTSGEAWFQEPTGRSQFTGGLHSACTPLAVIFAASAGKVPSKEGMGTPDEIAQILDTFLKADIQAAGFENNVNYNIEDSVNMINALTKKGIQIETTWNFNGEAPSYGMTSALILTEKMKTWRECIGELQPGRGAIIVIGGYAIAVRRLQNGFWEFFDAHNGADLGASKRGAHIKRCCSVSSARGFLQHVIAKGPAAGGDLPVFGAADKGQQTLSRSVEIALLKSH